MKKNDEAALAKLIQMATSIGNLTEEDIALFSTIWHPFDAKRKEIITQAGEAEKYLYFVVDGVQRIYHTNEHGTDSTILFTYAPSFGGILDAFMLQQTAKFSYEALSHSSFLRTSYNELNPLIQTQPNIALLIRQGLAGSLSGILDRLVELQSFSSEDKFKKLLQRSPHILQLVPQKYLANYLGIDVSNFSKLMNRVKI